MRYRLIVLFLSLWLAGCLAARTAIPPEQLDVFGVQWDSGQDYRQLLGVAGVDEPCLHGFDRRFEPLAVVIGYGRDGRVRKIVTRNPQTALFGIRPGVTAGAAVVEAGAAGFVAAGSPRVMRRGDLQLTLLVDEGGKAFGLVLERVATGD